MDMCVLGLNEFKKKFEEICFRGSGVNLFQRYNLEIGFCLELN